MSEEWAPPIKTLAVYRLRLVGPAIPSLVASPENFGSMLSEAQENLNDLLPEGYYVKIEDAP